jgi:hypothetical protein
MFLAVGTANADPIYLNGSNISVALGPSMAAEPFGNRTAAASLASIIDAPTAASSELHNQSTHVWVNGGTLELNFNFGLEYDLSTFHFWNYHSEGFDVDEIDQMFFDASMALVGTILDVAPALGNGSGTDSDPIFAEDLPLAFPSKVQFVNAVLSGSNNQVDFNNIGFTGELSNPNGDPNGTTPIPEPGTLTLMLLGAAALGAMKIRAKRR